MSIIHASGCLSISREDFLKNQEGTVKRQTMKNYEIQMGKVCNQNL